MLSTPASPADEASREPAGSAPDAASPPPDKGVTSRPPVKAPPGYKLVKVRKVDGTIVTVKKKLSPEELAAENTNTTAPATIPESKTDYEVVVVRMPDGTLRKVKRPLGSTRPIPATDGAMPPSDPNTGPKQEAEKFPSGVDKEALHDQDLENKRQRRTRFRSALLHGLVGSLAAPIVSDLADGDELLSESDWSEEDSVGGHDDDVDDEDLASVAAAAVAAGIVSAVAAEPAKPARMHARNEDGKETYKITDKDLRDIDEQANKRADDQNSLQRRWADFSFYFMASLSVILPLLFLVLAILIIIMDGESTKSNWSMMVDPIKISVTVWPIVFAAVTAQAFKTWATYRVERGIKLMELEQLVGSNSFGAVMKQPFFLRRLDVLTLLIFLVWSLSPVGSQALLRIYTLERSVVHDAVAVMYAPLLGDNRLLTPDVAPKNATVLSELWQAVSVYYTGAFTESDADYLMGGSWFQDQYNHPLSSYPCQEPGNSSSPYQNCTLSMFGIPVDLPPAAVASDWEVDEEDRKKVSADAVVPFENITFPVTSSYFNFTCDHWKTETFREINNTRMNFSLSSTLGVEFSTLGDASTINHMRYATLLDLSVFDNATDWQSIIEPDPNWKYAVIECGFAQFFFNGTVECWVDVKSGIGSFSCTMHNGSILTTEKIQPSWHTRLRDFSAEFVLGGSPYPVLYPYTPSERWASAERNVDGYTVALSPLTTKPERFAENFGMLFNTFVTIAHCPECIPAIKINDSESDERPTAAVTAPEIALQVKSYYTPVPSAKRIYSVPGLFFQLSWPWAATFLVSVSLLLIIGVASVALETLLVAPDILGYVSTLARNSKYLRLPGIKAGPLGMNGAERARRIGGVRVMVQDARPDKEVGRVVLGLEREGAERLKAGRLYR